MTSKLSEDTVHTILSDSQRRHLLSLLNRTGQGKIDDLARKIAAQEQDTHPENVSEELQQRVAVALVHNHLPRLAEHDLVSYDIDSNEVVLMDVFDELESSLSNQTDDGSTFGQLHPSY